MAQPGQWEVVKAKKNKNANAGKKLPKKKIENMPKLEETAPIEESQTMFDAFLEKERKKAQQPVTKSNGSIEAINKGNVQSKKKSQEKKKASAPPPPPPKIQSLEEAIQALKIDEMKTILATVEARFPESPIIWLKDIASFLNLALDVELNDPVFSTKPVGYPSSCLNMEIYDLLISTLKRCNSQTLQLFFEFCLKSMTQDMTKCLNTNGYRILLQCLAQEMPDIALQNMAKFHDFRDLYKNRHNICLPIFWVAGQAGNKSVESGFKVWLDYMFPFLGTRHYSKYIIDYLEKLLSTHAHYKPSSSIIGVKELFKILDFSYSASNDLTYQLQIQLQELFPSIKSLCYGPNPSTVLHNYFPSYLLRLLPSWSSLLKAQICQCLVECLTSDKHSYSIWRQLYTKHLVQSSLLISHLNEKWDTLPSSFPRKLLLETVSAFQVTNDILKGQGKASREVEDCVVACKALLTKMNSRRLPLGKMGLFFMIVVSAVFFYDIQQHGTFEKSRTKQFLKETGILTICEQAWEKIEVYSSKAYKWLEINVPIFYTWLCRTCGPYLELFWEKLLTLLIYLWNSTEGIRSWINVNVPPLLKWVDENFPYYAAKLSKFAGGIAVIVLDFLITVAKFLQYYMSIILTWLHTYVFTGSLSIENLQSYAGNTVQMFQQYTMSTYQWVSKYVAAFINPGK